MGFYDEIAKYYDYLFPLLCDDLTRMLQNSGFKAMKLFGDFKETGYSKLDSYTLVIVAK